MGLYLNGPHLGPTTRQARTIRQRHAEGWLDSEVARELGRCRETVSLWRRKLGLPANRGNERYRAMVRENTRRQLQADELSSLQEVRAIAQRVEAVRRGWPPDCTPLMCDILDYLEAEPGTRRGFCASTGRKYHQDRTNCTSKGRSAWAAMVAAGYIRRCGRRPFAAGNGRTEWVYEAVIKRRKQNPAAVRQAELEAA